MATEQLPVNQYVVGGQPTVSGYILPSAQYGFEEDAEQKVDADGRWKCKVTYSRRQTLSVTLEVTSGSPAYQAGGEIASGVFTDGTGTASAWKIRSATLTKTRGPQVVQLDLISQVDKL